LRKPSLKNSRASEVSNAKQWAVIVAIWTAVNLSSHLTASKPRKASEIWSRLLARSLEAILSQRLAKLDSAPRGSSNY